MINSALNPSKNLKYFKDFLIKIIAWLYEKDSDTWTTGPQSQSAPFVVVTWGRIFSPLTITQEEDGPTCPAPYLRTFSTRDCTSLSSLLASVALSFLTCFSLSWFCLSLFSLFFLLENSTDKGSSLTAVLCNGHVRNTCSLLPINSEESSHGLCVNDWKLLYSNKTLFIDLHISF